MSLSIQSVVNSKVSGGVITINGKQYNGNSVAVKNGVVYVDGKLAESCTASKQIDITISGNVESVTADGNIEMHGNAGQIKAGGSVDCTGFVEGDVDAGGSVTCGNVNGNVDAGGSVKCGNVSGDVDAGGSVWHGMRANGE